MKILLVCLGILATVGVHADETLPSNLSSSHWLSFLGSQARMDTYMSNHVIGFGVTLKKGTTNKVTISQANYSHSSANGPLHSRIFEKFVLQMQSCLTPVDVGERISIYVKLSWYIPRNSGSTTYSWECPKGAFYVELDQGQNVVVPTNAMATWPVNQYMIVTNVPTDIREIEYVTGNPYITNSYIQPAGTNFYPSREGAISLQISRLNPLEDVLTEGHFGYLVVRYYNGREETFDYLTGNQIDSTFLTLRMDKIGNAPVVRVTGWPGKQVFLETSSNLSTWSGGNSLILGTNGMAEAIFPQAQGHFSSEDG